MNMNNSIEVSRCESGYYILWGPFRLSKKAYDRDECIKILKKKRDGRSVKPITGYTLDPDLKSLCTEVMMRKG